MDITCICVSCLFSMKCFIFCLKYSTNSVCNSSCSSVCLAESSDVRWHSPGRRKRIASTPQNSSPLLQRGVEPTAASSSPGTAASTVSPQQSDAPVANSTSLRFASRVSNDTWLEGITKKKHLLKPVHLKAYLLYIILFFILRPKTNKTDSVLNFPYINLGNYFTYLFL